MNPFHFITNLLPCFTMIVLEPIGFVHNACTTSQAPEFIKQELSEIEILPEYAEGLQDIEQAEYIDLVFSFHHEKRTELTTRIRTGETRGIFASRSPRRPNHIGITTVKLVQREGNKLYVEGADALDGSPVVDIKYCDTSVFDQQNVHQTIQADSPRIDIVRNILANNTEELLLKAAQLHGHICPGLALGVLGTTQVMQRLYNSQEDPGDYTLTSEMQNCPVDGVLFVTGCTPGTHRYLQGQPENMCFYLKNKAGKGWKVSFKPNNREYMNAHLPANLSPLEKGFATLQLSPDELFIIEELD